MINLNEEFKTQKQKLINIFVQHLKQAITIVIMIKLMKQLDDDDSNSFLQTVLYISVILFTFNLMSAIFLLCIKKDFPKVEYFLVYAVNFFMFLILLVYSLKVFVDLKTHDQLLLIFIKSYIIVLIQKEIEILIIKVFNWDIANRTVNSFTNSLFPLLILSNTDSLECNGQYSFTLLSLLLINLITSIFNTLFNLILFAQFTSFKELRNFANLILAIGLIVQFSIYFVVLNTFLKMDPHQCQTISYIFESYIYLSPMHLLAFTFVLVQEVQFLKELLSYQDLIEKNPSLSRDGSSFYAAQNLIKHPSAQPRMSLKSLSSVVNNPMENSESRSRAPNFGEQQKNGKDLEKLGTSQFGASQHNMQGGMLHSWANVQNSNPFNQTQTLVERKDPQSQNQDRRGSNNSVLRQEESQIPENLSQIQNPMDNSQSNNLIDNQSQVNNPMESGSVVLNV